MKQSVSNHYGINIFRKMIPKIWQFFNDMSEELQSWEDFPLGGVSQFFKELNGKASIYMLDEENEWYTKYISLERSIEEKRKAREKEARKAQKMESATGVVAATTETPV